MRCPSQDWDGYVFAQDQAAAAEVQFYKTYRDQIINVAGQMVCIHDGPAEIRKVVDTAAAIVKEIVDRGADIE